MFIMVLHLHLHRHLHYIYKLTERPVVLLNAIFTSGRKLGLLYSEVVDAFNFQVKVSQPHLVKENHGEKSKDLISLCVKIIH